jgi:hypothetical protein
MSLAIYAPPRAILPIFNPADFPSVLVSTTSSTSNYNTAVATLTTINTNLTTYLAKLVNVGTQPFSQNSPNPGIIYANGFNSITSVSPSTSAWAIWAVATLYPVLQGTATTVSTGQISYATNILPNPVNSQEIRPINGYKTYTVQPFGYFQLNATQSWNINCDVNTVAPVGTSTIGIAVPQTPITINQNIYFINIK